MYEQTWTQDVNSTYIRLSEDIQDVFWTSYVRSIYIQCLEIIFNYLCYFADCLLLI